MKRRQLVRRRLSSRLSRRHEAWLYASGGVLVVSAVGWLVARFFLRGAEVFAEVPHPAEAWWLRLHGAAVIAFLVCFGALLPGHAVQNWRVRLNRASGLTVAIVAGVSAATGYGLYYIVDDAFRQWVSTMHWVVGLAGAGAFALHVVLGKRVASRRRKEREALRRPRSAAPAANLEH